MSVGRSPTVTVLVVAAALIAACGGGGSAPAASSPARSTTAASRSHASQAAAADWLEFGGNPQRSNASDIATGLTAANISSLRRHQVQLPGTVDSSPI